MNGKGSRNKGARGEREIVALLQEHGITAKRIARTGYSTPDVFTLGKFAEVKRREQEVPIKPYRWLEDSELLFMRRNQMPWLVTMELDTFVELLFAGHKRIADAGEE